MSKIVTIQKEVFTFNELSEGSKEVVKSWWLDCQDESDFTEMLQEEYKELLLNSSLKVQYSLSYCQGDGLNLYGTLDINDMLELIKEKFSSKEVKTLVHYIEDLSDEVELDYNSHYCYCLADYIELEFESEYEDKFNSLKGYNKLLVKKFQYEIREYIKALCKKYESWGYDYFYEISESDLQEICEANDYEFTEDGKIF